MEPTPASSHPVARIPPSSARSAAATAEAMLPALSPAEEALITVLLKKGCSSTEQVARPRSTARSTIATCGRRSSS